MEMSGREVDDVISTATVMCDVLIWPSSVSLDGLADEPNLNMQKAHKAR